MGCLCLQWGRVSKLAEGGDTALVVLLLSSRGTEGVGDASRGGTDGELHIVGSGGSRDLLFLDVRHC